MSASNGHDRSNAPPPRTREEVIGLSHQYTILYFDGFCGLCNTVVDWLLPRDTGGRLRFTPLQGETAKASLDPREILDLNTVIVLKNGRYFKRSRAVAEALKALPGWAWLGYLLQVLPSPLRDLGYRIVASTRYKLFGKKESCRIPTREERSRFLP